MKTNMLRGWRGIFAMTSTIALLGCLDQPGKTSAQSAGDVSSSNLVAEPTPVPDETPPLKAIIQPANLSPGLSEIIKLAQSSVGDEVLLAYIDKSGRSFNPTVDEIVYLKDLGLSEAVIASLVRPREGTTPVQQVSPAPPENRNFVQAPPTNANGPSPAEPAAPSYSVAAEPVYSEAAAASNQQVNYNYFESNLSPYGSWVDVPDYGRCWQPTVVVINRGWRPYSDRGHWLYTTSGWYWQSDYSWGWAPFHYGRWHCDDRIGWVWSPGSTWGPSWVSWRYTDSYCGWAPLPPTAHYDGFGFRYHDSHVGISFDFGLRDDYYTFIPTSRFCDRTPYRYYVSGSHSKTIYNNSVVINNYIRGNNNTIINEGIGRDRVSRATHTPIRTVALRDLPTTAGSVGRSERLEGNSLAVFRPNVARQDSLTRSRSRSLRESSTPTSAQNQPSSVSSGAQQRIAPSSRRSDIGRADRRETATATTTAPSSGQSQSAFPRTGSTPPDATRNSNSQLEQRHLWTGRANTTGNASPSGETSAPRGTAGTRQLPTVQYSAPTQRQSPSVVTENPREREAALVPQQITRVQPSILSSPQPVQREYNDRQIQNNTPTPRILRSLPSVHQPDSSVPDYGIRGGRIERSAPQVIQPAPREQPQREQQQRVQTPREQPQRSQPAPRQQVDRSDRSERGNRDKNKN